MLLLALDEAGASGAFGWMYFFAIACNEASIFVVVVVVLRTGIMSTAWPEGVIPASARFIGALRWMTRS